MPYAQGMSQAVNIWPEVTAGTRPGTVNADKIPVINPKFTPARNTFRSQAITGSPEPRSTVLGKKRWDFSMGIECNPSSIAVPFYYLYGTRSQQGTAALYHTRYTLGALPPFGAQDGHSVISRFFPYEGGYMGQGELRFPSEGVMEMNVSGMGLSAGVPETSTAVNGATVDRTTLSAFSYLWCRVKKDGAMIGYAQLITHSVNRALGSDSAIDETDEAAVIFSEVATVNGQITALVNTDAITALYTNGLSSANLELEVYVPYASGSGQGVWVYYPSAKVTPFSLTPNGTGITKLEGGFEAQPAATSGSARGLYFTTLALNGLTLDVEVDAAVAQIVTFGAGDDTPDEAVTAINAQTTGCVARVERQSGDTGGFVVIESDTTGTTSSIKIAAASTGDATMGYDNVLHAGLAGVSHEVWLANLVAV